MKLNQTGLDDIWSQVFWLEDSVDYSTNCDWERKHTAWKTDLEGEGRV